MAVSQKPQSEVRSADAAAPPLSIMEKYARSVADDVYPLDDAPPANAAADTVVMAAGITDIIAIVMAIFQNLVKLCPQTPAAVAGAIRNPNIRQRAALYSHCMDYTAPLRLRKAGEIYRSMLARGSAATEADAKALVEEALTPSNLLI